MWDNFGFDPATGNAMIATAGLAARKYQIDRREVDEITLCRYEQYFDAKESGFLDRVLVPLEVLNLQGRSMGTVDDDLGVRQVSRGRSARPCASSTPASPPAPRPTPRTAWPACW